MTSKRRLPVRSKGVDDVAARYRQSLRQRVGTVRIVGEEHSHPLEKVFVELSIIEEFRNPRFESAGPYIIWAERLESHAVPADDSRSPGELEPKPKVKRAVKPDELLRAGVRAVVVGQPGYGKTTLLKYLALKTMDTPRLPVFIELKSLDKSDFKKASCTLPDLLYAKAIQPFMQRDTAGTKRSDEAETKRFKTEFLARLDTGEATILIDGLDEVCGAKFFAKLSLLLDHFISATHCDNVIIVSTRPYALQKRFAEMKEMEIAPLNARQAEAFVKYYYEEDASTRPLLQRLRQGGGLNDLARVPFLLGVLCELYRRNQQVVENRLQLYEQIVLRLAVQLDLDKSLPYSRFKIRDRDGTLKLDFLKWLACERMLLGDDRTADSGWGSRLAFTADELLARAKQFVSKNNLSARYAPHELADDVILTPLLREVGPRVYAFAHFTIQEYLAAKSLVERDDCEAVLCRNYFNTAIVEWEVLPMALGLSARAAALFVALGQLPESLNYASLRLCTRGLGYGAVVSEQWLASVLDPLVEFITDEDSQGFPYRESIMRSLSAASGRSSDFVTASLISFLTHKNTIAQRNAAEALGKIGSEQAVTALLAVFQMKDETGSLRQEAAKALGEIGGEPAMAALLAALKDEESYVGWSAADALGEIGSEQAVAPLLAALWCGNWAMQEHAAEALGKIGSEQAVAALHTACWRKNGHLRGTAATALGKIGGEQAVAALIEVLDYGDFYAGTSAAESLGEIGGEQAVAALLAALKEQEGMVQQYAAKALGKIGGEQVVMALLAALMDEDAYVRRSAATGLGAIGSEQAVAPLLVALMDEHSEVRGRAAEALGKIGSEQGVAALLAVLKDEDAYVRGRAAEALGAIGCEQAVAPLLAALKDEDADVRWRAAEALGENGGQQAVMVLRSMLSNESHAAGWDATAALGKIGGEPAVPALLEALNHQDSYVRRDAAQGLEKIKHRVLAAGLLNALSDKNPVVRQKAAEVVGYYTEADGVAEELSRLSTDDPTDAVKAAATQARKRFIRKLRLWGKDVAAPANDKEPARVRPIVETGAAAKAQLDAEREALIRAKYEETLREKNSNTKGKALEELSAALFASIEGFTAERNRATASEEIDVVVRNERGDAFWSKESQLILIECKNRQSKRVGKSDIVLFQAKIRNRGRHCHLGFLISTSNFADTIEKEMLRESQSDILVVPINGNQLRTLVESDKRQELLKQFVIRATLV
ncbi:MAG TPA: HEAT repeat domain-containing protein [Blastocatellia bacterium]|nr:HEAT repeat domain-containing protein [Blastocatellia bacterium]